MAARDTLVLEINELRREALAVRGNIEELRDQIRSGGVTTTRVVAFSAELQQRYRNIFESLSGREFELGGLQELLPGAREARKIPPVNALDPPSRILEPLLSGPMGAVLAELESPAGTIERPEKTLQAIPLDFTPPPAARPPVGATPPARTKGRRSRKPPAGVDRQVHTRYPFATSVRCRTGRKVFIARSSDVSRGGMFVEGRPTLPVGTPLAVVFAVEGFPLEIESYVAYETPAVGMGLRFHHVDPIDAPHLEGLLQRLESERSSPSLSSGF